MVQAREVIMRVLTLILGIIVLILGLVPILKSFNTLPPFLEFIPREGIAYNVIVMIAGILIVIAEIRRKRGRLKLI